jgi:mRNA-degrading endonuclease toxin of MazEF toxin-antitoxin module
MTDKKTKDKELSLPKRGERINKDSSQMPIPRQGEIWLIEFPLTLEDRKPTRPCLVISDNIQNQYGKWIVVIPLTTEDIENIEPFEVYVENTKESGLEYPSKLQFNYPRTVDRARLKEHLGVLNSKKISELKRAWKTAFDSENWEW